jgi:hypothetical protein
VSTKRIAGGIPDRFAMTATAATTASSKMSTWIVEIIGAPSREPLGPPAMGKELQSCDDHALIRC